MKVSIIGGGGVVGSSAAYKIANEGHASEIVLMDARPNTATAHALDIEQAVAGKTGTLIRGGDIEETRGSDVIIMTAGVPHRHTNASRSEFMADNLPIIMGLAEKIVAASPDAIWIMASVPVDPFVYLIHELFSVPREKSLGLNFNDTIRFRWAIARTLSVHAKDVTAFVLGEHGESQVPLFSNVRVKGEPVTLDAHQMANVQNEIHGFFAQWRELAAGRTAGWTSAESLGDLVAGIAIEDDSVWACSTPVQGEYGINGVSLGLPVRLGRNGVREIVEFELNSEEKAALERSAEIIKEQQSTADRL